MKNFDYNKFYGSKEAILEPSMVVLPVKDFPEIGVSCFSKKLLEAMVDYHKGEIIGEFKTENGRIPIYQIRYEGKDIALYMSRVGSPAAVIQLEEAIALGLKKLFVAGSCGSLDSNIHYGDLIIPCCGERDEGTSFHYYPKEEEITSNPRIINIIQEKLKERDRHYICGKTWTTDGLYRETTEKFELRKMQGCITVDMEYTALQAVANFREIDFGQIFYCEDNLDNTVWEARGYLPKNEDKRKIFMELPFDCVVDF